jgi:nitroreductase
MEKTAPVDFPIQEILKRRWSPRAFADRLIEPAILQSLFEAARWSASASNAQPWNFVIATRDKSEEFERLLSCLVDANVAWGKNAPVIGISVAKLTMDPNGRVNRHAYYDVGQAMANLSMEAAAHGLQVHQMAGIQVEKSRGVLSIPEGYDPVTGFAIGYPGDPHSLPEKLRERELAPRQRKPLSAFVYGGQWGEKAEILS